MGEAGVFDEADGISFHPYALSPKGVMELSDTLMEVLEDLDFSGEVWVTEIGYPTRGWFPTKVSENKFPAHIIKTLTGLAARNIKTLLWYELFDTNNPGEYKSSWSSEDFFGIAYPNRTAKAGYHAFALCGKNLTGKEYNPNLPLRQNLPKRTVSLLFTGQENENVLILWNESGSSYPALITLPGRDQRLYDINTGEFHNMTEKTEIDITKTPLFITWVGAAIPLVEKQ